MGGASEKEVGREQGSSLPPLRHMLFTLILRGGGHHRCEGGGITTGDYRPNSQPTVINMGETRGARTHDLAVVRLKTYH